MKANRDIIRAITAPRLGPGPSVDGNFVPDVPAFLIAQGRFHKNITVLIVDDSDEVPPSLPPSSSSSQYANDPPSNSRARNSSTGTAPSRSPRL